MAGEDQDGGEWARLMAASSLVDVLNADEEIVDLVALDAAAAPQWVRQLPIPAGWQPAQIGGAAVARIAVSGPRADGGWDASETVSVWEFTGWPGFRDVMSKASGTLRDLHATDVSMRVLPVPSRTWTAAVRSSGTFELGGRAVWAQQSNYVAGSDQPRAGRLIIHNIFVDDNHRPRFADDVAALSEAMYQGFIGSLGDQSSLATTNASD